MASGDHARPGAGAMAPIALGATRPNWAIFQTAGAYLFILPLNAPYLDLFSESSPKSCGLC
jgi:hypothetical protein